MLTYRINANRQTVVLRKHPADLAPKCPRCGYNLYQLTSQRCPECGRLRTDTAETERTRRAREREKLRRRQDRRDNVHQYLRSATALLGVLFLIAAVGQTIYGSLRMAFFTREQRETWDLLEFKRLGWMAFILTGIVITAFYLVNRHYTRGSHPAVFWILGSVWMVAALFLYPI